MAKTNLTVESTVDEWLDDPVGLEILRMFIPQIADSPRVRQAGAFPLNGFFQMTPPGAVPDGTLENIQAELDKL